MPSWQTVSLVPPSPPPPAPPPSEQSASPRHAELANATAAAETSAEIRHVLSEPVRHGMAALTTGLIAVLTCCLLGTLVAYCTTVCAVQPQL